MNENIFSTQAAKGEESGYQCIVDRLFNWDWRESDTFGEDQDPELTSIGVRIRDWQHVAFRQIKNLTGSQYADIYRCAYAEGVSRLSDSVDRDKLNQHNEFVSMTGHIVAGYGQSDIHRMDQWGYATLGDMDDVMKEGRYFDSHGKTDKSISPSVIPNHYSQIEGDYAEDLGMKGWIHRSVLSIGLSGCERVPSKVQNNADEVVESVVRRVEERAVEAEKSFASYIGRNLGYWLAEGIHESALRDIVEATENMVTQFEATVSNDVETLVDEAIVLDSEKSQYRRYEEIRNMDKF